MQKVFITPNAGRKYGSPQPSKGISSGKPLPLGSCVLNAVSTSYHSSMVIGAVSPSFFSQSSRIISPL